MGRGLFEPWHLILLVAVVAVLFGWKKLPDISRSVGRSMRIFKSEVSEMKNDGKEGRPSPAANDTVPGGVVPPQPAPATPPPAQAPQYAAPQAPAAPQYTEQPQPAAQPQFQQPVQAPYQPEHQDSTANGSVDRSSNPAL